MDKKVKNSTDKKLKASLNSENIVIEEYKYASSYTLQMLRERGNMLTLYASFISALVTGVLGINIFEDLKIDYGQALPPLFLALGVMHSLLFIRFAHLEKRYYDYQQRMNKIRKMYADNGEKTDLNITEIIPPIKMPRTIPFIYPVWPTTLLFPFVASFCFSLASLYFWHTPGLAFFLFFITLGISLILGKKTGTS